VHSDTGSICSSRQCVLSCDTLVGLVSLLVEFVPVVAIRRREANPILASVFIFVWLGIGAVHKIAGQEGAILSDGMAYFSSLIHAFLCRPVIWASAACPACVDVACGLGSCSTVCLGLLGRCHVILVRLLRSIGHQLFLGGSSGCLFVLGLHFGCFVSKFLLCRLVLSSALCGLGSFDSFPCVILGLGGSLHLRVVLLDLGMRCIGRNLVGFGLCLEFSVRERSIRFVVSELFPVRLLEGCLVGLVLSLIRISLRLELSLLGVVGCGVVRNSLLMCGRGLLRCRGSCGLLCLLRINLGLDVLDVLVGRRNTISIVLGGLLVSRHVLRFDGGLLVLELLGIGVHLLLRSVDCGDLGVVALDGRCEVGIGLGVAGGGIGGELVCLVGELVCRFDAFGFLLLPLGLLISGTVTCGGEIFGLGVGLLGGLVGEVAVLLEQVGHRRGALVHARQELVFGIPLLLHDGERGGHGDHSNHCEANDCAGLHHPVL